MLSKRFGLAMMALALAGTLMVAAADGAGAAQRVELRVLLIGANGEEPSFQAWQAQLRREGVPHDVVLTGSAHAPITDATLAQTLPDGTRVGRYQAVILSLGSLPGLADAEWTALAAYEQAFQVRRLTAYAFPGPGYGLQPPTASGPLDGTTATLTASGRAVFPYLNGPVTIAAGTFGYQATPEPEASFDTLLQAPGGAALLGVVTHADGRQEMVQTFDANQYQLHSWLLRHGQLAWVTRGVYLGEQRNYLELQVDDVFLPDDTWDVDANVTDYDPAVAIRMTPADVAAAVRWQQASGVRMDMVFNGGGSVAHAAEHGSDPLLAAFQANRDAFTWVNHTWDHPNLDCSTGAFIARQIDDNVRWAEANGFPVDRRELVTGEHSGLANLVPGNPGTIDPPTLTDAEALAGGALAAGDWEYAVTGLSAHGETVGSRVTLTAPAGGAATLAWDAICHATGYRVYRRVAPAGAWELIGSVPQPSPAFADAGPATVSFADAGASGSAAAPPAANGATVDPYAQNPAFAGALADAGVTVVASDASKPYPRTPTSLGGPTWPAGASFVDGGVRAVPRYPTNVYYNVATEQQLLDEYNYLYLPPALGGACVDSAVTTCESAPVSWAELVRREAERIFGHAMGNDPRPHYFHQSNIAQTDRPGGGVLYPVVDAMLADYRRYFAANAPIVQLRHAEIADQLARQEAWAVVRDGQVRGWIEGDQVTIVNDAGGAVEVPLTGTDAGGPYGGVRSGWAVAPAGASTRTAAIAWPGTTTPPPVTPPPVTPPPSTPPPQVGPPPQAPPPPAVPADPGAIDGPVTSPAPPPSGSAPRASVRSRARARSRARTRSRRRAKARKRTKRARRCATRRGTRTTRGRRRPAAVRRTCRPRHHRTGKGKPRPVARRHPRR